MHPGAPSYVNKSDDKICPGTIQSLFTLGKEKSSEDEPKETKTDGVKDRIIAYCKIECVCFGEKNPLNRVEAEKEGCFANTG